MPDKAEKRFTEALVRAGDRIENLGMRAAMRRDQETATSAAAQAGGSGAPKASSEGSMSYSPTSPADSPRGQDNHESAEESPPVLMMAGGQAKEEQMKTTRGQAWPAEFLKREAVSGSPVNRHPKNEPALLRGPSQRRLIGRGDQTMMTQIATMTAEMSRLDNWQSGGRNQPTAEKSGMKM